jgi:hypothetical protein
VLDIALLLLEEEDTEDEEEGYVVLVMMAVVFMRVMGCWLPPAINPPLPPARGGLEFALLSAEREAGNRC